MFCQVNFLRKRLRVKLTYANIKSLSDTIRKKKVSPVEIVEGCLSRIEELNHKLNAFITVLPDQAREQARKAELEIKDGKWRGPLHGIPVGIKDFYDTAGVKTTAAFEQFRDRVPKKDAVEVAKLRAVGAIIIGKTNMHELGLGTSGLDGYFGPVQNPWNARYIPGGSSSGSAAAVATGMCYATLDTDAIGSCRLPASCCGVVGFKGTYGLLNPRGILDGEQAPDESIIWLSHPAITTRSIEDTSIILLAMKQSKTLHRKSNAPKRKPTKPRKIRIGVANNFQADKEVSMAFEKATKKIANLGHIMTSVPAPLMSLDQGVKNIVADRNSINMKAFKDVEIYILPTNMRAVPTIEEARKKADVLSSRNTYFANYYGLPAASIPCGFDSHGLPLGFQMVAKQWDEDTLMFLARRYQDSTSWHDKHPVI
jgi:aspartyl-tRNA(Asn)/glutamyl-tRNA(Gln) amidotransferase subunit A